MQATDEEMQKQFNPVYYNRVSLAGEENVIDLLKVPESVERKKLY